MFELILMGIGFGIGYVASEWRKKCTETHWYDFKI